ncbi:MAG: hypothetical protein KF729_36435 [Sandaracinaceae bacterium]|nr:hypothetical protein [Sandaracinaceae bacterium]
MECVADTSECAPASSPGGCWSGFECAPDHYCHASAPNCVGEGSCRPRARPVSECGRTTVCGCDGRTYSNDCEASLRGVSVAVFSACGTRGDGSPHVGCGDDADCPSGRTCCRLLAVCVQSDCPECCAIPPPGTFFPCRDDSQCESHEFCDGVGCGTAGGCRPRGGGCGGELRPVCGCDGATYSNECWAAQAGIRVAHADACDDGP